MLTFLTGGARSGKSSLALRMATRSGDAVVFLATARPEGDDEWRDKLARHRAERPPEWTTVEEPLDLVGALGAVDPRAFLVVDCLTLWVANAIDAGWDDDEIERAAVKAASTTAERSGSAVVVTNEVGGGIVPVERSVRRFRDTLGRVNGRWAERADRAYLVVAGRVLPLLDADA